MVVGEGLLRCAQDFACGLKRPQNGSTSTRACALAQDDIRWRVDGEASWRSPGQPVSTDPTFARALFFVKVKGEHRRANVGHPRHNLRRCTRDPSALKGLGMTPSCGGRRRAGGQPGAAVPTQDCRGGCPHTRLLGAEPRAHTRKTADGGRQGPLSAVGLWLLAKEANWRSGTVKD